MEELSAGDPSSEHYDEVQFRRGEYFFTRRRFYDAEKAYGAILAMGAGRNAAVHINNYRTSGEWWDPDAPPPPPEPEPEKAAKA